MFRLGLFSDSLATQTIKYARVGGRRRSSTQESEDADDQVRKSRRTQTIKYARVGTPLRRLKRSSCVGFEQLATDGHWAPRSSPRFQESPAYFLLRAVLFCCYAPSIRGDKCEKRKNQHVLSGNNGETLRL